MQIFVQVYAKQYINLKLTCRKNKSYNQKRTAHRDIVSSRWNHLSSESSASPRSGFRNHFILDPFSSNTLIILILFFFQIP
jgi:hypothetical protein